MISRLFLFNIFFGVLTLSLTACQQSAVKRDPLAPPVAEQFVPKGHLQKQTKVEDSINDPSAIPSIVNNQKPLLPPLSGAVSTKLYSVSAVNVPVADLLFKLAKDANRELDLYAGISGNVTINAINQPLDNILERIAEQVGFVFELSSSVVSIRPDFPEWRNYKIDYVNISRDSTESIDMKMTVASGTGGSSGGSPASSSSVKVTSKSDFWKNLDENIKLLAQIDPNANMVMSPATAVDGQAAAPSPALSGLSQNTVVNPEAGVISVYTTKQKHKAIAKYIDEVTHRAKRQVLIEATVVEVSLNDDYQAGIDWTKFGTVNNVKSSVFFTSDARFSSSSYSAALTGAGENILDNLKFLKVFGDTKVLSSPKIMAINNQTALLKVVNNLVYFKVEASTTSTTQGVGETTYTTEIQTVPVGFTMSVTPFIGDNDDITLNVRPTISRKIDEVADPNPSLGDVQSLIPIIQEKEMSSVLKLRDRQIAIIGGLIEDSNGNNRVGLPWLGDAPIIGDLFSQRSDTTTKSELVIFIRPTVIKNPDIDNGDLTSIRRFLTTKNQ
ncbi:pilus (MSHA type) biogenesis protein MshL [Thiomicrorhabdus sediminis]|uniref:Pilus (MSHA type) biogenesis protein MshL n=1 Tax=Thiomicrorhabdus sediminis TaxID=2580412 RepID=A0A4V1HHZ0_9GAMM|nr:pilus (MSHA type) biogenesis protein MshL [Thiomicrorhabdus sediminis]QCU90693.1 pilus (MSHA type) biogenesis protein MshL [Thiomicrorhabdus sediminis]